MCCLCVGVNGSANFLSDLQASLGAAAAAAAYPWISPYHAYHNSATAAAAAAAAVHAAAQLVSAHLSIRSFLLSVYLLK